MQSSPGHLEFLMVEFHCRLVLFDGKYTFELLSIETKYMNWEFIIYLLVVTICQ